MQHNFLYSVEREYSQPMSRIWEAWTDAAQLQARYHPTDLTNVPESSVSEPVVGGSWVRFSQFGELSEEHIPMAKAGMDSYFQSLADYLNKD
jgi:uncharacterized protein YndB with AHSA1/START domain